MPSGPDDVHEWISFEEPDATRTWMFDATFLRSNWTCIFGAGCQGVLDGPAEELNQGCCSYGAHFVDDDDIANLVKHVVRLEPRHWQFHRQGKRKGFLEADEDGGTKTSLADDACIFLNRPGFAGGAGCALHIAATEAGERPLDWKPNVCWQLPLRLHHTTEDDGHMTSTLREWKRHDWGEGGATFHWWCTADPEAFIGGQPVYEYLRDEIIEMIGEDTYRELVELLRRPVAKPLPHPAVRR